MNQRSQRGIGFIEVMIGMALGLLLIAGVFSLFSQTQTSLSRDDNLAQMSDSGRFAMAILSNDIAMAGFWGRVLDPLQISYDPSVQGDTIVADCGPDDEVNSSSEPPWIFDVSGPYIEQFDDSSVIALTKTFECLNIGDPDSTSSHTASSVKQGTDVISIKRVHGNFIATTDTHKTGRIYFRANSTAGGLYRHTDGSTPQSSGAIADLAAPVQDWTYQPSIYFVRPYSRSQGDDIPTLCEKILQAGSKPSLTTECLAEGVEDLQLEFGIDSDNDGTTDYFDPDPDATELLQIASVRVYLLVRSIRPQRDYENKATYTLGSKAAFTPDDNYLRRLYTTTVQVRNPLRERAL